MKRQFNIRLDEYYIKVLQRFAKEATDGNVTRALEYLINCVDHLSMERVGMGVRLKHKLCGNYINLHNYCRKGDLEK